MKIHPSQPAPSVQPDVLVVGGGAVGGFIASSLREAGARVLVIEAGPRSPDPASEHSMDGTLPETDAALWRYRCTPEHAQWSRVRALGGRTRVWGGWCVRACAQNVVDAERAGAPWPLPFGALQAQYARVERELGVVGNRDGLAVVPDGMFVAPVTLHPRLSELTEALGLPVLAGRIATVAGRPWLASDALQDVEVWPETVALRVIVEHGRVLGVECHRGTTVRCVLCVPRVVLAASAIETARLLRSSVPGHEGELRVTSALIASHLVVAPGRTPEVAGAARAAFVPRFVNVEGGAERPYVGGFSLEVQGPHPLRHLGASVLALLDVPRDSPDDMTAYLVHALGTMLPSDERTVRFDDGDRDALGRPLPVLRLATTEHDRTIGADMDAACLAVAEALGGEGVTAIPHVAPDGLQIGSEWLHGPDDGERFDDAGRCAGAVGLYVADARSTPWVSDRHPTLTMLAHAARVADAVLLDLRV